MDRMTALRVFVTVVEYGSFSGAARTLRLSNAAVSKNISELEAHLGVELISRSTRRMRLTDAGSDYHQKVERILADLVDADEAVADGAMSARGKLHVTAPMTFGIVKLASLIPEFLELYGDVSLDLDLNDATVDIIAGRFDVAIRGSGSLPNSTLVARKLMDMDRVVCASPAYLAANGVPDTPEALLKHKCIIYAHSNDPDIWRFEKEKSVENIRVPESYRVNSSLAIRQALLSDYGLATIPRIYVSDELMTGRLVTTLDSWRLEPVSIFAIFPSGKFLPRRTRVFIDFLVEKLIW